MKWIITLLFLMVVSPCSSVFSAEPEEQLKAVELQAMADTFQYALENNPTSKAADWANPDAARSGGVVPTRTFEDAQGQPCREFISKIIIGGKEEQGFGTACRQQDGHWQLVANDNQKALTPEPSKVATYFVAPPSSYYTYPRGFYGSTSIYLSFGSVYRSGKHYRGSLYLDGLSFRHRYPSRISHHNYIGPRFFKRYRLQDELDYRAWDRHREPRREKHKKWRKKRHSDQDDRRKRGRD